jgi:ornithine cyclodeaminase
MLFLDRAAVEACLDPEALIAALSPAMADLSAGRASVPNRISAGIPEENAVLAAMVAYLPSTRSLAAKLVDVFPGNRARGLPSHQAIVAVFDASTGTPLAVMDGEHITAMRTAAGSALATRFLARPDSRTLAIVGTGVQARAHAAFIPRVARLERILVAGRTPEKAIALAGEISAASGLPAAVASPREAVEEADIVCATTHSPTPVIERPWVRPGTHINSVGVNWEGREIDAETVRDALVVVESRAAALAPPPAVGANDLIWAIRDGVIDEGHVHAEVGEIVAGRRPGRTSPDQITLYKSVGVAVQDAAAAALVLAAAKDRGLGVEVGL